MVESSVSNGRTLLIYGRTGPWCLEASYARAFSDLGWRVETVDADPGGQDLAWWIRSRVGRRLSRSNLGLRRWASRERNDGFCERIRNVQPDLVLLINGEFLMPGTMVSVRQAGIPVVVYHPDAPVPGNGSLRAEHLPVAREVDLCLVWSRALVKRLNRAGARRVAYLPFAWDPEVFPFAENSSMRGPDVVFVGGWDPHREHWLEPVAERFDLAIWGPDYWGSRTRPGSPLRDCWQGRALRGREAAEMVANAGISLNILREQNLPDGTNMRTFEVPGAGGFSLASRTLGATEIYPEGEAGGYFGSVAELVEKIECYLERPEVRRSVARRAHEITVAGHRYIHRAQRILDTVGGRACS